MKTNALVGLIVPAILLSLLCGCSSAKGGGAGKSPVVQPGSVVFLHPDGAGLPAWEAYRYLSVGPDGMTHYDRLPELAMYRGHMSDSLTGTSNGGATVHAYGVRVGAASFGNDNGKSLAPEKSWVVQAREAGLPVGLINSGTLTEPGTACFVTDVPNRNNHAEIARQLVESGAAVMLGGGEQFFLPEGTRGEHGEGTRTDGRDLIAEARAKGYTVVRTRAELLAALPPTTPKVLGLFAAVHTFNDATEQSLQQRGLPLYKTDAPTLAEMTRVAISILSRGGGKNAGRYALVVEEEGTDNFGNANNASGVLEGLRRADETLGLLAEATRKDPGLLVMTTCDSDAGGMRVISMPANRPPTTAPARESNGAPVDGVFGSSGAAFLAAPDRKGTRFPFFISWSTEDDVPSGIAVKAVGNGAGRVRGHLNNTDIARLARETLGVGGAAK